MKTYYQEEEPRQGRGKLVRLVGWGVDLVAVITLAVFVVMMFGTKLTMSGRSMEPVLDNGDVVLLDKLWYNFSEPKRMDVVAFESLEGGSKTYIKRVVGLPGERVQIKDGVLYVNGQRTELPKTMGEIVLPGLAEGEICLLEDEYFVLGDNPDTSEDSRFTNVGNVHISQMKGKVWFRSAPFARLGFVK